jgi:hypothetical protein
LKLSNSKILLTVYQANEIEDLPPGGLPEYFTDVKEPGPASGLDYL